MAYKPYCQPKGGQKEPYRPVVEKKKVAKKEEAKVEAPKKAVKKD